MIVWMSEKKKKKKKKKKGRKRKRFGNRGRRRGPLPVRGISVIVADYFR